MNLGYDREAFYYFIDRFLVLLDEVKGRNLSIGGFLFPLLCFDEDGKDVVIKSVSVKECTLDFLYDFLHEEMFLRDSEPLLIAMPIKEVNSEGKFRMLFFEGITSKGEMIIDKIRDTVHKHIEEFLSQKGGRKR